CSSRGSQPPSMYVLSNDMKNTIHKHDVPNQRPSRKRLTTLGRLPLWVLLSRGGGPAHKNRQNSTGNAAANSPATVKMSRQVPCCNPHVATVPPTKLPNGKAVTSRVTNNPRLPSG